MNVLVRFPNPLVKSELGNLTRMYKLNCSGFMLDLGLGSFKRSMYYLYAESHHSTGGRGSPPTQIAKTLRNAKMRITLLHMWQKKPPHFCGQSCCKKLLHSTQSVTLVVFAGLEFHNVTMYTGQSKPVTLVVDNRVFQVLPVFSITMYKCNNVRRAE